MREPPEAILEINKASNLTCASDSLRERKWVLRCPSCKEICVNSNPPGWRFQCQCGVWLRAPQFPRSQKSEEPAPESRSLSMKIERELEEIERLNKKSFVLMVILSVVTVGAMILSLCLLRS